MTLLVQELPEHQQKRIAFDEQVLWCGKGRPVAWFDGAISSCLIGLILSVFVGIFACLFLPSLFTNRAETGVRLGALAFSLVWFGIFIPSSLALLLAPFWHWLGTRRTVWVITDRRVLRLRGKGFREWRDDELLEEPEWIFMDDGGRDFAFGQHRSSSKSGSHMEQVLIESVPPEDVPRVESALLRLAELRKERLAADLPNQVADVRVRFSVSRDPDGRRVRIVYRKNRPVFGVVMLGVVLAFAAAVVTLVVHEGDSPTRAGLLPLLLILPILGAASFPFFYEIFGRREIVLENGQGRYFNGVGRIGLNRSFTYDEKTHVRKGRTDYQVNGRSHFSVLIRADGQEMTFPILAHGDEAVADEFIRLLRAAIRPATGSV